MKQKILITGILGYVATEIVKTLDSEKYEISGIDSNFIPSSVKKLTKKNIKFFHADLFDEKTAELVRAADFVIHTAGITAVPTVAAQASPEIDSLIEKVGTAGTKFVLETMRSDAKIVFLSTHVCWENLPPGLAPVNEKVPLCPNLAYARSKTQSEIDVQNSGKNFLILRLASVFGYNRNIRWKILPNLFSKMSAGGQTLKVFGATNTKPLVGISDVANFIKFLLDKQITNEIFNVVSEHFTVEQIARICQKFTNCEIVFTNDEIPNSGYFVDNQKILKTGFKFQQILETEIFQMIHAWKNH